MGYIRWTVCTIGSVSHIFTVSTSRSQSDERSDPGDTAECCSV